MTFLVVLLIPLWAHTFLFFSRLYTFQFHPHPIKPSTNFSSLYNLCLSFKSHSTIHQQILVFFPLPTDVNGTQFLIFLRPQRPVTTPAGSYVTKRLEKSLEGNLCPEFWWLSEGGKGNSGERKDQESREREVENERMKVQWGNKWERETKVEWEKESKRSHVHWNLEQKQRRKTRWRKLPERRQKTNNWRKGGKTGGSIAYDKNS